MRIIFYMYFQQSENANNVNWQLQYMCSIPKIESKTLEKPGN